MILKKMISLILLVGLFAIQGKGATFTEDFNSDPTARGWIDASANNFYWYASGGSVIGYHVKRHPEEAFYLPLGATYTQDSNFSASWETAKYGGIPDYTNQELFIGFFNKDNWFLNGDPDVYNAKDVVAMGYWDGTAPSWSHTSAWARAVTTSGTYRDSGMYDIGDNGITYQCTLTYTAGAGANSAGQLVVTGSMGGTLMFTETVDLQVGDVFAVNAFGVFTGHTAYNNTAGWTAAYPLDNVQITPGPVTSTLSFGTQWIRSHDFPFYGWYSAAIPYPLDPNYKVCGFSALACGGSVYINQAPNYQLGKHVLLSAAVYPVEQRVIDLVNQSSTAAEDNAWYVVDEPQSEWIPGIAGVVDWLKSYRPSGLIYLNVNNTDVNYLDSIMTTIQPHAIMFDNYPFYSITGEDIGGYFTQLGQLRSKAQDYNAPYFSFVQTFYEPEEPAGWRMPSESEMRTQLFSALTAGYKGIGCYIYDRGAWDLEQGMVTANSDGYNWWRTYNPMYYYVQAASPDVKNLGNYLRFLGSTDYRYVPGISNPTPGGVSNWSSGAGGDYHITNIDVNSSGAKKDGLIGFFTDDNTNQYFMFMNMYRGDSLTADQAALSFTITFDNTINQLYRINRATGVQEVVNLSSHQLTTTLPGGTGDLYSYTGFESLVPTGGVSINAGASSTKTSLVTLNLSASGGDGAIEMKISNNWTTWSNWEAFSATKSWTLIPGDGIKTVYVQYRDEAENYSCVYQDTIEISGSLGENFNTDPNTRGWIDASPNNFALGPSYVTGIGLKRHLEEAFYLPLNATYTQNNNFWARFEIAVHSASQSYQEFFVGFFNKDDWFLNGEPDVLNAQNVVAAGFYDQSSPSAWARVVTDSMTYSDSGFYNIINDILYECTLTYTAGAGDYSAGQLVFEGRTGGSLVFTKTANLMEGDNFSVNSFGIFTGHCTFNGAAGFWAYPFDNVEIVPPPATCEEAIAQGYGQAADLNNDCDVNFKDLEAFAAEWLECIDPTIPVCSRPWQ